MTTQKIITEKINQAILHLGNQQSHHSYGSPSSSFSSSSFSMNHDYRTEYATWYKRTSFHDSASMPEKILNRTAYFEEPYVNKNILKFEFSHLGLDTTWGYGKYFDGESIEPTPETETKLSNLSELFSTHFNAEIVFSTDVDVDYEDDLNVVVRVILPTVKTQSEPIKSILTKEEKLNNKALVANEKLVKYNKELTDFNLKVQNKIQEQSSKLKTCSHCDSKVNIKHIRTHKCPVCSEAMYSNTELKRFTNITSKIDKSKQDIKQCNLNISKYLRS